MTTRHYDEISAELAAAGYDFTTYDRVLEAVAYDRGLLDGHGEMKRPFDEAAVAEIYSRLGPAPA